MSEIKPAALERIEFEYQKTGIHNIIRVFGRADVDAGIRVKKFAS